MKLLLSILLAASMAGAATLKVDTTIADAMRRAAAGDTIVIPGPAVYGERLVVSKPVILLGTNGPVVDGGGLGSVITVQAAGAELRHLTVRHGGADLGGFDSGILIMAPRVTVAGCRVEVPGFGIYIRGVDDCVIDANTVSGDRSLPSAQRGNGIHLWKTRHNRLLDNVVSGTRDGIYFSYADENEIRGNRIENTRFGIHYMFSHRNRLVGNSLTGNVAGAALMFARDCLVQENRAINNHRFGILLKQIENSRIIRNTIQGQNRGLFVQQAVGDRFEGNRIAQNDIGLYLSNGSEKNVFVDNAFVGNTDQLWQPAEQKDFGGIAANRFSENRRGNYWSDYVGADANGDGIGDTPYHETDLFGYLVDHHPEARVFALSPAAALLRKGEQWLPLLEAPGVTDAYPLTRPAAALRSTASARKF